MRSLCFLCLFGLALGLVACSDADDAAVDSGVSRDGLVGRDARPDAAPGVDASTTCTAEDLLDQFMCGSGRKCTLTNGLTTVGCAEAGFTPAYGGCEPTFPDTCEIGSLCSNQVGTYRCLPFCGQPGAACAEGRCGQTAVASEGSTSVYLCQPSDPCDPVTADAASAGCGGGEACYVVPVGGGQTFCEPQGSQQADETCVNDFDCVQGYACFGGGPMTCRKVCHKDTDTDCPTGQTCGPLNDDYGLCF